MAQGSAGDVARSDPVSLAVTIVPQADGVTITTKGVEGGTGQEDIGIVRLPVNASLIDNSEILSQINISSSKGEISEVYFLAPVIKDIDLSAMGLDGFVEQNGDVFTINSYAWSLNAANTISKSIAELQEILADNLGVKTGINVSGEINVNVAFKTLTSVGSNVSKTVSEDLTLSITPLPEHFTEDDAPILLSMYPGLRS